MALNKLTLLDKSRSSSRTETEDTVKPKTKTRSISSYSLDDKNTKEQKPKEILIRNKKLISDKQSFQVCLYMEEVQQLYRQTEIVSLGRISKKKLSEISITGNTITQEPDNQGKKAKVESSIDEIEINIKINSTSIYK